MMRTIALAAAATLLGVMAATAQDTTVIRRGDGMGGSRTVIKRGGGDGDAVVVRRRRFEVDRPRCKTIIVKRPGVTKKIRKCR